MEFEKIIREREAVRSFKDKEVNEEIINKILEAANLAPTAKNKQPIKILVVKSEEGLAKIDKVSPCRYNAPIVFVVCGNIDQAFSKENYSSYEMDSCIVATHMMLEATNLGVDNIWIKLFNEKALSEEFGLPNNLMPVMLLPIGYKTDDYQGNPMHTVRKDLSEIVEYV